MSINFGALNKGPGREQAVHPRDIFNALPNKPRGMDYVRGPQDQVLQEWWNRKSARDLVIKMNTGGGKTIVGLLVAQSSLAEGVGPAAYLVHDHYLADQVMAEARRLGIAVTDNAWDMDYARGRAILVDVFQRLFNGQSVFGVDGSAARAAAVPAPGTIVIDDAHACLAKAEHAFRLTIPRDDPVYDTLLALFQDACLTRAYAPGGTSKKRHEMRACMSCRRRATHTTSYHGVRDSEQCSLKQQAVEVGRVWFSLCPDTGGMS